ncbi:MAG: glycosyltransferase [Pleurocapsa sp. MO_226.B13]|nr:glycosyltransferase [Pleurocapsa sp. MO_226.B13]
MKITILSIGTCGDVQPFIALGLELQKYQCVLVRGLTASVAREAPLGALIDKTRNRKVQNPQTLPH